MTGVSTPSGSASTVRPDWRTSIRDALRPQRPVPPTAASIWLRRLIAVTAVAVVVVEAVNLVTVDAPGYALSIRSVWALLRVIGFLVLMRAVRFGRAGARPFGLILAVTTVFAVARLTEPREGGLLPRIEVLVGFAVLALLCGAIVVLLYRSDAVAAHLSGRPVRRHIPGWVLTTRVAVLAYSALVLVPLLVGVGTLFADDRRNPVPVTIALLVIWAGLFVAVSLLLPFGSLFVLMGKGWARWLIGLVSVLVLVVQPWLCYTVLGLDGLLRDGVPLIITAILALVGLHRSRGVQTWIRA
jgi:hypothetical protein